MTLYSSQPKYRLICFILQGRHKGTICAQRHSLLQKFNYSEAYTGTCKTIPQATVINVGQAMFSQLAIYSMPPLKILWLFSHLLKHRCSKRCCGFTRLELVQTGSVQVMISSSLATRFPRELRSLLISMPITIILTTGMIRRPLTQAGSTQAGESKSMLLIGTCSMTLSMQ